MNALHQAAPPSPEHASRQRSSSHPRIAYLIQGNPGEAVFFLHGIGGNKTNWRGQLNAFAEQGYQAIAWDVRGYGDSDGYDGPFRFDEISADLMRLMDELGIDKAHFVGLSMGGRILMDFAWRHPERVERLVLCAAFPSFSKGLTQEQREDYLRLRKQPLLSGRSFAELAPELSRSLVGPKAPQSVRDELIASICELRQESYLKALDAAAYFDRTEEIQQIAAPTLLLYAEDDRLTPPALGAEVASLMRDAQLCIVPSCGHLMNLEAPEAFNQLVLNFLREQHAIGLRSKP